MSYEHADMNRRSRVPVVESVTGFKLINGTPHAMTDIGAVAIDAKNFSATDPIFRGLSFDERTKLWRNIKTARTFQPKP